MITTEQEKWINHLSDETRIKIIDFDPTCQEKFEAVKGIIQARIGTDVEVLHCGATSLGISGQDEIDVYIPVFPDEFNKYVILLTEIFGNPKSHYPSERARFVTTWDGKHIDVFVINKQHEGWINSQIFDNYLRTHPEKLFEYKMLKERGNGLSVREYYRRKIEFLNAVIEEHEKDV